MTKLRSEQLHELHSMTVKKWQNLHSLHIYIFVLAVTSSKQKIHLGFLLRSSSQESQCDARQRHDLNSSTWSMILTHSFNVFRLSSCCNIQWASHTWVFNAKKLSWGPNKGKKDITLIDGQWVSPTQYTPSLDAGTATSSHCVDAFWVYCVPC